MADEASKTCDTPEEVTGIKSSLDETDGTKNVYRRFQALSKTFTVYSLICFVYFEILGWNYLGLCHRSNPSLRSNICFGAEL